MQQPPPIATPPGSPKAKAMPGAAQISNLKNAAQLLDYPHVITAAVFVSHPRLLVPPITSGPCKRDAWSSKDDRVPCPREQHVQNDRSALFRTVPY